MAYLYTPERIQEALNQLRIDPRDGVTTGEAARICEWRSIEEFGVGRKYNEGAIRRHIQLKNLVPINPEEYIKRFNVEDIFRLPLSPRKGGGRQSSDIISSLFGPGLPVETLVA